MNTYKTKAILQLTAFIFFLLLGTSAWGLETINLQLKWSHAFQFAGYYAAKEKGFYREAGLDVHLHEASPGTDPIQPVLNGEAEFGVGTSSLLLARKAGSPIVVLAVVFQHSPLVLIARQNRSSAGTQGIHDIVGKRVMIEPQSDELLAYLKQEGIALNSLQQLPHSFQTKDLIEEKVDAISAYVTNEPYYLDRAHVAYQTYTPRTGGIDFYGDNLFTTEEELNTHPDRVRAFREASLRGWQYAMEHPEEIADLIASRYSHQHPRDFYLYEAKRMMPLLRTDLIEVGYMNRGRWRHIADTYADLGLLPRNYSLDGFLYEPDNHPNLHQLYIALTLLTAVSGLAGYIFSINRRLSKALAESRAASHRIRHMAQHDPLTDLPNRALFFDRLGWLLTAAKRDGQCIAVMFIDLDNFKPINDNLGHAIGDHLLKDVASRLQGCLRESDMVARIGGDEFVILLRDIKSQHDVIAVAEKLRDNIAQPFAIGPHHITAAISIGIALYPDHGSEDFELLKRADDAMYAAKREGKNRIKMA